MGISSLFSFELGDIGKREVFPLVLQYGGEKAGTEEGPCFQV